MSDTPHCYFCLRAAIVECQTAEGLRLVCALHKIRYELPKEDSNAS